MEVTGHPPTVPAPALAADSRPVAGPGPRVFVAVRHPGMASLIRDLLTAQHRAWVVTIVTGDRSLAEVVAADPPDAVIVDAADFPDCCCSGLRDFPPGRVVVVSPEPDTAYRTAALASGAGAWVAREAVGDELVPALRAMLG